MVKKIGFWKRFWKVTKALTNFIFLYLFFLIVCALSAYMIIGSITLLYSETPTVSIDFVKYLTALAFSLAGFTFLGSTLIKEKSEEITRAELNILNIFWMFLLSGFFGLAFISLNYLQPTFLGAPLSYFGFIKKILFPVTIILSLIFFFGGLIDLMLELRIKLPKLHKKLKKREKEKVVE